MVRGGYNASGIYGTTGTMGGLSYGVLGNSFSTGANDFDLTAVAPYKGFGKIGAIQNIPVTVFAVGGSTYRTRKSFYENEYLTGFQAGAEDAGEIAHILGDQEIVLHEPLDRR